MLLHWCFLGNSGRGERCRPPTLCLPQPKALPVALKQPLRAHFVLRTYWRSKLCSLEWFWWLRSQTPWWWWWWQGCSAMKGWMWAPGVLWLKKKKSTYIWSLRIKLTDNFEWGGAALLVWPWEEVWSLWVADSYSPPFLVEEAPRTTLDSAILALLLYRASFTPLCRTEPTQALKNAGERDCPLGNFAFLTRNYLIDFIFIHKYFVSLQWAKGCTFYKLCPNFFFKLTHLYGWWPRVTI